MDNDLKEYKDKLNTTLLTEWSKLMEETLDVAQLCCINTQWPACRAKILRKMNDFMRIMRKELDLPLDSQDKID